ncbi:hypothetical protein BA896_021780 [Janthinobacterium lividum]|uniref:Phage tail protein n=1 Tax=Janthinobacterium lividum TaxID=29581 RepID=A0A1E8PL84_9BURK|nr:hypothetical protein BA896_021780 [Janthinobacterium lividum]
MGLHANLLKLLLPPVAYEKTGPTLSAEIFAEGKQLDDYQAMVEALLPETDPRSTTALLPDWERVYGLPDECRGAADTVADRRARLATKVAETGGLSAPYFIALAAALGYTGVTITSFRPTTCEMSCEGAVRDETWRFAWQVNVPNQQNVHRFFSAESASEDPVDAYRQGPVECLFIKLKPAGSLVLFNYN